MRNMREGNGQSKSFGREKAVRRMLTVAGVGRIVEDNVADIIKGSDLMVDALDNFQTRYLLNRVALEKKIPFFHGAVYGFEGQVTTIIPGETACLRCIFPKHLLQKLFP